MFLFLYLTRKKLPNLGLNSWSSLPGSYPLTIRLLVRWKQKWRINNWLSSYSFFLSFFIAHNSKTIPCRCALHISHDCSATRHLPFPVWGSVWIMTGKLRQQNGTPVWKTFSFKHFFCFCIHIPGVEIIVRPHPDYILNVCYRLQWVCLQRIVCK